MLGKNNIVDNVLGLGEGGELEALLFVLAPKFDRRTKVQFATEPPLLPNPCYTLARLISRMFDWNTKPFSFLF